jgi:hypothetical protein
MDASTRSAIVKGGRSIVRPNIHAKFAPGFRELKVAHQQISQISSQAKQNPERRLRKRPISRTYTPIPNKANADPMPIIVTG